MGNLIDHKKSLIQIFQIQILKISVLSLIPPPIVANKLTNSNQAEIECGLLEDSVQQPRIVENFSCVLQGHITNLK